MVQIYFLYTLVTNVTSTQGCGNDERHQDMLIAPDEQVRRILGCINFDKVSSDIQILKKQFLPDRESDEPIEKRMRNELETVHVGQSNRLVHVDTKFEKMMGTSESLIADLKIYIYVLFSSTLKRDATCFANPHAVSLIYNTIQYQLTNTNYLFLIYTTIYSCDDKFTDIKNDTSISDKNESLMAVLTSRSNTLENDFKCLSNKLAAETRSICTSAKHYENSLTIAKKHDNIAFDQTKCYEHLLKHIDMISEYWGSVLKFFKVLHFMSEKASSQNFIIDLSTYIKNLLLYGCSGAKLLAKETELYISKLRSDAVESTAPIDMRKFKSKNSNMISMFQETLQNGFCIYSDIINKYNSTRVYNRNDIEVFKVQQKEIMREYERIVQMLLNDSETSISNVSVGDAINGGVLQPGNVNPLADYGV